MIIPLIHSTLNVLTVLLYMRICILLRINSITTPFFLDGLFPPKLPANGPAAIV